MKQHKKLSIHLLLLILSDHAHIITIVQRLSPYYLVLQNCLEKLFIVEYMILLIRVSF